jgi:neutral trehalase
MNNLNFKKVKNHIAKILPLIKKDGIDKLPYPFLSVTHSKYYPKTIFGWDNHHMSMRLAYNGEEVYLKYLIDNFLLHQKTTGFIANTIHFKDGGSSDSHVQPFLMQGAFIYLTQSGDLAWTKQVFAKLGKYLAYYEKEFSSPFGLFHWQNTSISGIDNEITQTFFLPETIISPDLNAWLVLEYTAASKIAASLGDEDSSQVYQAKATQLKQAINDLLWYPEKGTYAAYNLCTGKHQFTIGDEFVKDVGLNAFQSCANLIPLYARVASQEQAAEMIEKYVLSPDHFLSPFGIRSLSKASEYYNNAKLGNPPRFNDYKRITNSNWQGPIWFPINYFTYHGLLAYDYKDEAKDLADRIIDLLANSLDKLGSFTENYNAETGEPLYASGFASWNVLADMLYDEAEDKKWLMEGLFTETP